MPWPLGVGELQGRLKRALGIRGAIPLEVDESVVPVVLAFDASHFLWSKDPRCGIVDRQEPASVGNFSFIGVIAALGTYLEVPQVWISGLIGAATRRELRLVTGTSGADEESIVSVHDPFTAASSPAGLAARSYDGIEAAQTGSKFAEFIMPLGEGVLIPLGVILDGDDPQGRQSLKLTVTGANEEVRGVFWVREHTKR